jgi:putative salt-induced outer membrane protein YdiY
MSLVRHTVLLTALAGCVPATTFAQAAAPPPPPRHETRAEVAFVGVSGNATTSTFGLGFEAIARPGRWVFTHRLAFVRNESDKTVTAQSFAYSPRAERKLNARVSLFAEYAYFRDRFAGVANRHQAIGGVSVAIVTAGRHRLSADGGAGFLDETRLAGANISSATYNGGTSYTLKISDTADLSDSLALVGTVDRSEDWRLVHVVALTAKVTSAVSLKVSNAIRYANFPATGFKTTDTITSIALVSAFKSRTP